MSKMGRMFNRLHERGWGRGAPVGPTYGPELFAFKNGEPLRVLRPEDAARKMATAGLTEASIGYHGPPPDTEAMDRALNEQPHQFIGFAAKDGKILDRFGRVIDAVRAGDSFVSGPQFSLPAFMTTGKFHEETWGEHNVVVLPRPDLKADSNTGVVVKSKDRSLLGAVILRPGSTGEVDCHIPSLNRIVTGDPAKDWRGDPPPEPPAAA